MAQQLTAPKSSVEHAADKDAARRRKAGNRRPASAGTVPVDLNVRRDAVARDAKRKQRLNDARDYATLLMQQHGNHTFTTVKKGGGSATLHPRFCTETTAMAMAHLCILFDGNIVERNSVGSLLPSVMDAVRLYFVMVCERFHIVGAYGQTAKWYGEVLEKHRRDIMRASV